MPKQKLELTTEFVSEATEALFLGMVRAMGDEDGHPLNIGGEAAIAALVKADTHARAWLFRVKADGPFIGYVVLTLGFSIEYGDRDGFINELYVVPDARGKGVGAIALEFASEEARKLGLKALHLEVMHGNERALHLYRKHGFAEVDRHLMNKQL